MSLYDRIKAAQQRDSSIADKPAAAAQDVIDSMRHSIIDEKQSASESKPQQTKPGVRWIRWGLLVVIVAAIFAMVHLGIGSDWLKTSSSANPPVSAAASTPDLESTIAASTGNSTPDSGIESSPPASSTGVSTIGPTVIPTSAPTALEFVEPQEVFTPVAELVLDGKGIVRGSFDLPQDVAVDSQGMIYVADTGNHRVQKINANGRFLIYWGQNGQGNGPQDLIEPVAIAVDKNDKVLVLDSATGWVKRYNSEGEFLGQWAGPGAKLSHPRGMLVDFSGNVWIADTGNSRLLEYAPDGQIMLEIGPTVAGTANLREPVALAMDGQSNLYVADTASHRILKLDSNRMVVTEWPIPPATSAVGNHLSVTVDQSLLVTDPESNRLLEYSLDGHLRRAWGSMGLGAGQFAKPVGIGVHGAQVYVADTFNNRLQVFSSR